MFRLGSRESPWTLKLEIATSVINKSTSLIIEVGISNTSGVVKPIDAELEDIPPNSCFTHFILVSSSFLAAFASFLRAPFYEFIFALSLS